MEFSDWPVPELFLACARFTRQPILPTLEFASSLATLLLPLQKKLDQLPAVDIHHAPAKLPSKLHMFAYVSTLDARNKTPLAKSATRIQVKP